MEGNRIAYLLYSKLGFKEIARLPDYVDHFGELQAKIIMKYEP